ncbi:MAG: transposase [Candidatus Nanopelagicales bacterium]
MFESVDWSFRGQYMLLRHWVTPSIANDALADPDRVVINSDYSSVSGRSMRVIGFSRIAESLITVIVLIEGDVAYGVNGWQANERDQRIYLEGGDDERA